MNEEIKNILEKLKKPCHKIWYKQHYQYWEECDPDIYKTSCYISDEGWIRDEYENEFIFQIINYNDEILPKEIKKLQLYWHISNDNMNLVVTNKEEEEYLEPEKIENVHGVMYFEPSHNLPDWKTLEELHNAEFKIITSIIEKENSKLKDYRFYEKYDEFVEEILGHENHYSFVGGNLNQMYHLMNTPSNEFKFIMQIETECHMVYIFQNRDDNTQYRIEFARYG